MRIGIVKERKEQEYRVAATPSHVKTLVKHGHKVYIEYDAGINADFTDDDFKEAGAILGDQKTVWENSDLIYKVKEPIQEEYKFFREDLMIICYFHLAADEELMKALVESGTMAIAYETVEENGSLPLLKPMSEIGGCLAVHDGVHFLGSNVGGKGVLLQGLPGVPPAHVVVVGGGVAGTGAVRTALGIGARVSVIDINLDRLAQLADIYGSKLETIYSNDSNVAKAVESADLVIGAVLVPGGKAPTLITKEMVQSMEPGSVIADIAIDQGSCVETMDHPTTHDNPVYKREGILHYAVANIPGKVPKTATHALSNVTSPYALEIAKKAWDIENWSEGLKKGVNIYKGKIVHSGVAESFDKNYTPLKDLI